MGIKNHTLGETRYLTYELMFKDGEHWIEQEPFWGPLDTWLKLTEFKKRPSICIDLIYKGESHWVDQNGVTHKVSITNKEMPKKWGTGKKKK